MSRFMHFHCLVCNEPLDPGENYGFATTTSSVGPDMTRPSPAVYYIHEECKAGGSSRLRLRGRRARAARTEGVPAELADRLQPSTRRTSAQWLASFARAGRRLQSETVCELRNGSVATGGARGRADTTSTTIERYVARYSLSMNGGAQVPEGGGKVGVWCMEEQIKGVSYDAAIVMIKVDRFS